MCVRMTYRLPFETLTTETIVSAPYLHRSLPLVTVATASVTPNNLPIVQSLSSATVVNKLSGPREVKELDEEKGKKIIALIYQRKGSMEKKGKPQQQQQQQTTAQSGHQSSYYLNKHANESNSYKSETKKEMNLLERVSDYLSIESARLIKHIDKELLIENAITLEDLISLCDCSITDLMSAGIVTQVKDLTDLGFKMSDLVINRNRFQAQQLADLFKLNHQKLRKMPGVEFGVVDLLQCHFYPNELAALNFSLDDMIQRGTINATQLRCLNFSLPDLISLQFSKEHLDLLGISRRQALDDFKWSRKDYAEFTGEPLHNGRKKMM